MSRAARLAAWAALCLALAAWSAGKIEFSTDITNFMPDGQGAELAQISRELARSDLARTMVLTLVSAVSAGATLLSRFGRRAPVAA